MRVGTLLLLVCMTVGTCRGDELKLFHQKDFSAADFAQAVNHFVALGEERAIRELSNMQPERVGWVCRVLFISKTGKPLRPPSYGALALPRQTMPPEEWPLYPVASSGGSFFVLSEGYMLGGKAEPVKEYLAYCRSEGMFRTELIPVPTRAEAQRDAGALRDSHAWKAIKWEDSGEGWSYRYSDEHVWKFIQGQADRVR